MLGVKFLKDLGNADNSENLLCVSWPPVDSDEMDSAPWNYTNTLDKFCPSVISFLKTSFGQKGKKPLKMSKNKVEIQWNWISITGFLQ